MFTSKSNKKKDRKSKTKSKKQNKKQAEGEEEMVLEQGGPAEEEMDERGYSEFVPRNIFYEWFYRVAYVDP